MQWYEKLAWLLLVRAFVSAVCTPPTHQPSHTHPSIHPSMQWYEKLAWAWLLLIRAFVWAVCAPKRWGARRRRRPDEASLARRLMLFSADAQATAMSGGFLLACVGSD